MKISLLSHILKCEHGTCKNHFKNYLKDFLKMVMILDHLYKLTCGCSSGMWTSSSKDQKEWVYLSKQRMKKGREPTWRGIIQLYTIDSSHFLFIYVVGYHKYCKLTLIRRKLGHTPLIHMYSVCETDLLKHYAAALFGDVVC